MSTPMLSRRPFDHKLGKANCRRSPAPTPRTRSMELRDEDPIGYLKKGIQKAVQNTGGDSDCNQFVRRQPGCWPAGPFFSNLLLGSLTRPCGAFSQTHDDAQV